MTDNSGTIPYSATYSYLANSPLVSQIVYKTNTTTRMTTTKSYDFLNRLISISSVPSGASTISFGYTYNNANQRVRVTMADGSYWLYIYDQLGQVISGHKFWSDGSPVAGQPRQKGRGADEVSTLIRSALFDYAFDSIGNRTSTLAGGDQNGLNQRSASYTANALNQYTQRTVPGDVDVMGISYATNTVTVNGNTAYRKVEYFRDQLPVNNGSAALWTNIIVAATGQTSVTGNVFVAQSPENFGYDADGNMTNDGRWVFTWDGENRLVSLQGLAAIPTGAKYKLDFIYDAGGRRIQKLVSTNNGSAYYPLSTNRFLYDAWNLVASLNPQSSILQSFMWGLDLSGSPQDAGGVSGLLEIADSANGVQFITCDGNGNGAALVRGADGTVSATYEYGVVAEMMRSTGPLTRANPFRLSTKFQDDESDLIYYGHRYFNSSAGRWLTRDLIEERGGINLYSFVGNDPLNGIDVNGLAKGYRSYFNVTFEPHHFYTKVWIGFHAGRDKSGRLCCESPKLAQIAVDFGGSLGHQLNPWGPPGKWFLDTDKEHHPWYNYQNPPTYGTVEMVDAPGSRWWHPGDYFYPFYQFFETCAVCTDGGPGNYKILGCVNWGHHIAGLTRSYRWGEGQGLPPVPPSADFVKLFKYK